MAYLINHKPLCEAKDCAIYARYDVRSRLMSRDPDATYPVPKPRCKRHAQQLYDWYEQEEARAGIVDADRDR